MTAADVVVDASVIVRAFTVREPRLDRLVVSNDRRLATLDFAALEVANAFLGCVRHRGAAADEALQWQSDLRGLALERVPAETLVDRAFRRAVSRGLSAYDAAYLALAESRGALLVTADRRLAEAYERSELVE